MAKKNTALAVVLSIIFPGLGLLYDGEYEKGLLYLVLQLIFTICYGYLILNGLEEDWESTVSILYWLTWIIWVISLYDTYATTKSINM